MHFWKVAELKSCQYLYISFLGNQAPIPFGDVPLKFFSVKLELSAFGDAFLKSNFYLMPK